MHTHACFCEEKVCGRGEEGGRTESAKINLALSPNLLFPRLSHSHTPPLSLAYSAVLTCVQYVSLTDSRKSFFFFFCPVVLTLVHCRLLVN